MSSWNNDPAIEYILCASAHMVFTTYVFFFSNLELFLPCQVRMISINLLLCTKYYVTAGIYTLWVSSVDSWFCWIHVGICWLLIWSWTCAWYKRCDTLLLYCFGLCDIYFYTICCRCQMVCWCKCTVAFPVEYVNSYLYYGAVFEASVVWLSPPRSRGYVQCQQLS